jgi:cell division protein FtsQ
MPPRPRFARSGPRAHALPLPWQLSLPDLHPTAWLARFAPTRRSVLVGLAVVAFALGAYLVARETSLFAIGRIEVYGAPRPVERQVQQALASFEGAPLVGLDGSAVLQKVEALPTVLRARYDREFPHTLRVTVVPERPASVLRRGADSWLVSARGRVMERLGSPPAARLPRIWISTRVPVRTGANVAGKGPGTAARALGLAGALGPRVASASYSNGALVFHLRSGLELLLGDPGDVKLKVAVAERVLWRLPAGTSFLDVSMPGRPVAGTGSPTVTVTAPSSSRG